MITMSKTRAIADALVTIRGLLTDEQAYKVSAIYLEWKDGVDYEAGERFVYGGSLYKALAAHKSQANKTPVVAADLYAEILGE